MTLPASTSPYTSQVYMTPVLHCQRKELMIIIVLLNSTQSCYLAIPLLPCPVSSTDAMPMIKQYTTVFR